MSRWWPLAAFGAGVLSGAAWPRGPAGELRVRSLVLVDEQGREVGRFASTPAGAELVVGGAAQASLVTEGEVAALNLLGERTLLRRLEAEDD
ncbi:MAG: hypothetical protein H6738_16545 [Alphaproteobacteria bacterium]|nr:hypothetical protein [Alphaproteobacteria bacterium]MCB9698391.1 hypothetical protein [Alphaproteobacteria bacterium]